MSLTWRSRQLTLAREYAQAKAHTYLFGAVQAEILRIAGTGAPDEAIAHLLRATRDTLGFSRGIYFGAERERGIAGRWQIDGTSEVVPAAIVLGSEATNALQDALRAPTASGFGTSRAAAPVSSARAPYLLSRLAHGGTTFGVLYVDGATDDVAPYLQPQFVHALTAAAALALGNSLRLARAQELASRDGLTGLLNRRALSERLALALNACADRGSSLTYLMIDYDDLKAVNDKLGHMQGDAVLQRVAETLTRISRAGDVLGRYGGDEFVMLLPRSRDERAAELVARLSSELRAQELSCSIGAACYPQDAGDEAGLRLAADRALYASKAAGKNRFTLA